jgi:hypothetical protein
METTGNKNEMVDVKWYDDHGNEHIILVTHLSGGRFYCTKIVHLIDISPLILPFNIAKVQSFDE